MEITTEIYHNAKGKLIRRHIVTLGDTGYALKTRELWQLIVLALVELGQCLSDDPAPNDA